MKELLTTFLCNSFSIFITQRFINQKTFQTIHCNKVFYMLMCGILNVGRQVYVEISEMIHLLDGSSFNDTENDVHFIPRASSVFCLVERDSPSQSFQMEE